MGKTSVALAVAGMALMGAAIPAAETRGAAGTPPEVLKLREQAWRSWFAGDEATLGAMLPPEFIGIGTDDGEFATRTKTLEESRAFHAGGGRLASLEFPQTESQRYGETVILYGRYRIVLEVGGGQRTISGRLTEVFVRQGGRWMHTAWHLDQPVPGS